MDYYDTQEAPKFNISGVVGEYCGDTLLDIEVYIEDNNNSIISYSVFTDSNGKFVFWGDSLDQVILNPGINHRIVALIPGQTKYTNFLSLNSLIYSDHYLGCSLNKTGEEVIEENKQNEPQVTNQSEFSISPNPTYNKLYVTVEGNDYRGLTAEVIDITGRVRKYNLNINMIDATDLASGVYYIEVFRDGKTSLGKKKVVMLHD